MFILALRMRDARIAPGAAAVLAKEPGQIRWTVLRIATKVIDRLTEPSITELVADINSILDLTEKIQEASPPK